MRFVRTRHFALVLSVWFIIAFPWACMRHCAMHVASMHHPAQFVCQLQFHGVDQGVGSSTLGSNSPSGGPSLTLFVLTSSIVLLYVTQTTAFHSTSPHWQTYFLTTPVPPPKSA